MHAFLQVVCSWAEIQRGVLCMMVLAQRFLAVHCCPQVSVLTHHTHSCSLNLHKLLTHCDGVAAGHTEK